MAAKSTPKSGADKLAEQDANGTRTGVNKPEPSKPAPKAGKPEPTLTKAQLTKAAAMRADGKTWNEIRAAFGVKLGSPAWFRAWEREGIDHIPAGERVKAKGEATDGEAANPATPSKPAKSNRTVKRSAAASKS